MPIILTCRCGQHFATEDRYTGHPAQCPYCGAGLVVPELPLYPNDMEFCNFCHQYIPRSEMREHHEEHVRLQDDGQHTDYPTLEPEFRASEEELKDAPKWYIHTKCKGEPDAMTGMPDDIIQTYLVNPWFYLADRTYCCGCEKHVPLRECVWSETGEDLQTYTNRLRAARPETKPSIWIRLLAVYYAVKTYGVFG